VAVGVRQPWRWVRGHLAVYLWTIAVPPWSALARVFWRPVGGVLHAVVAVPGYFVALHCLILKTLH
jgi:hypothetical protein